ncbi:MAG TPA: hypothetical protein VGF59_02255 [Bryobacteraceae bacterium]
MNSIKAVLFSALALPLTASQPVFPGAKGFGVETPAGRGGQIIRVANLNSEGPGSLRAAIETKGPRIVVFEVAGVIDLNMKPLVIAEPFITIAGQTAPSPGITLVRAGIDMTTHDILLQHIRVRMGDAGRPKKSGWEPEVTTKGAQCYNIVVDHCSMSWAVDENLSASGPRYNGPEGTTHNVTFSNNIIAEGLRDSSHSKGPHSKGTLVHDNCRNIAVIGNLYAHNDDRNPYFKAFTTGVIVNNVVYNARRYAIEVNWIPQEWEGKNVKPENARVAVVGNVVIQGPDTPPTLAAVSRMGDVFLEDNLSLTRDGKPAPMTSGEIKLLQEKPVWPAGLKPMPAKDTVAWVTTHAGARPKDRDAVDKRIVRDFEQRQGRLIDSQEEVGGYPKMEPVRRALDIPRQNVEAWLAKLATELE